LTDTEALLAAEQLAFWRGGHCLFEGLDFRLRPGQLALVTGPNGSGKTTLLRAAAGLTPPTEGQLLWNGADVHTLAPEQRGGIAFRGHLDGLKKDLTVLENLTLHSALWGGSPEAPADLLEPLMLARTAHLRARYLSAGQRRRVGLAALKLCGARLWILDEPTTSLDAQGLVLLRDWLSEHINASGMALIATHQPEELMGQASMVIEL
jgi:heme exporter protein A